MPGPEVIVSEAALAPPAGKKTRLGFIILPPDDEGKYSIEAEGIRALFVPYSGALSNLFIKDANGVERDVVLGYDSPAQYKEDKAGLRLGVVGRYASPISIRNQGEYIISDLSLQESYGWMDKDVTIAARETNTIMFNNIVLDKTHGQVASCFTWTVTPYTLDVSFSIMSVTKRGPFMLGAEVYWNLDGFQNPATSTVLDHTLSLPYSGLRISGDGEIRGNKLGSASDFWSKPKRIGQGPVVDKALEPKAAASEESCYILNRNLTGKQNWRKEPVATLSSGFSGIKMDILTDQEALYVQTYEPRNEPVTVKKTQRLREGGEELAAVPRNGAIKLKPGEWVDTLSHPEWQRDELIFWGPESGAYQTNWTYKFTCVGNGC